MGTMTAYNLTDLKHPARARRGPVGAGAVGFAQVAMLVSVASEPGVVMMKPFELFARPVVGDPRVAAGRGLK